MRIGVVGGLNMDIHLFDVHPSRGQAPLVADRYLVQPGGKGANVARAAARLGAEVVLVGRVGDDEFGRDCIDCCAADGVDVRHVTVVGGEHTGFVTIELGADGHHRSLVFAPGANDHLSWQNMEVALDDLERCDVVVVQAEVPTHVLDGMVRWAAGRSVPLFVDPTPPEQVDRVAIVGAEAITPDLEEAAALTGRTLTSQLSPILAAEDLRRAGAQRVLVKCGPAGVILADDDRVVRVPTLSVEAVDETGAGDVFLAALAVRRAEGADWVDAARFANVAAALSVSQPGLSLPTEDEVLAALPRLSPEIENLRL